MGDHAAASPSRSARPSRETHRETADPRRRALPGRGRGRPRAGTRPGHFIHITSHRAGERARRHRAWLDRIGLPYDELYCSDDKVARCTEIGIDLLIDDSPENLERAIDAGHHRRDARAPVEPRAVRDGGRRLRRGLGRARAQPRAGARVSARSALPRPQRRPARLPARRSSPSARSPTGAARSASRALLDKTLYEFLYHYWFRCEVEGIENVPADGGALLVSNHAGALPPDATMIAKAIKEEHPRPRPVHLTVEHFFKGYPCSRMLVPKIGGVPAHPANVHRLLYDEGQLVLVFPEGRKGTEKLYKDRYKLRRFGRGGFVEAAMRARVPIVPIAVVGAEEAMPVVRPGRRRCSA